MPESTPPREPDRSPWVIVYLAASLVIGGTLCLIVLGIYLVTR